MQDRTTELQLFKTSINLSEYAASVGYDLDRQASSRNSAVMRHANGDKVVIARSGAGHWIYFSVQDDRDNGTIIDFVQKRTGGDLGTVRQTLRPWVGSHPTPLRRPEPGRFAAKLEPSNQDIAAVQAAFAACEPGPSLYLERRGLNKAVQGGERVTGTIFTDKRRNTVFPHWNRAGLSGFELKNTGFTGFAKGGEKGLWHSRIRPGDDTAVFAETAIDALSYFALEGHAKMRLFSTGGALNPVQPGLIAGAVQQLPEGGTVILATDFDPGGDELATALRQAIGGAGRDELHVIEDRPKQPGADWNDVLRGVQGYFRDPGP